MEMMAKLEVQVVRSVSAWEALEAEWRTLFAQSPSASPTISWEWLHGWWQQYGALYGAGPDSLRILTVRREGVLVAALPLYLARARVPLIGIRRLRFLSTGESELDETCAEYLDLLYRESDGDAAVAAIRTSLEAPWNTEWDELVLDGVSEASPLVALSTSQPESYLSAEVRPDRQCHIADLTGGLDGYLQRVSSHQRKKLRRLLRAVETEGAAFDLATSTADVEVFYEQMVELHQLRWSTAGKPGCFASDRFSGFHRTLCLAVVPAGSGILARLSRAGQPLGVIYGFVVNRRFHFYQCGLTNTPVGALESPGTAAHLLLMDHLARTGVVHYDFLGGSSDYKQRLATEQHALVQITIVRSTGRTVLRRAYQPLRTILQQPQARE
jgi:CelD/BcsL family acetyltransferase involved in cellulose biosynthesis